MISPFVERKVIVPGRLKFKTSLDSGSIVSIFKVNNFSEIAITEPNENELKSNNSHFKYPFLTVVLLVSYDQWLMH